MTDTSAVSSRSAARWGLGLLITAYVAITVVFIVRFALRSPPPVSARVAGSSRNLCRGATVRASSWDWYRRHHPLFAIDGEPDPTLVEKWVSAPRDRAPWLEIRFASAIDIARVNLVLLVRGENPARVTRGYRLRCLRGGSALADLTVRDNRAAARTHLVDCPATDLLRLDFDLSAPGSDVVRLFEVEASGRSE